jgi:flagellar biosynthesis protein FlhF
MEIKTFRARSMQEALQQIRTSLGPDAAVLEAREVGSGLVRWLTGTRQVEVMASADIQVPTRLPALGPDPADCRPDLSPMGMSPQRPDGAERPQPLTLDYCAQFRQSILSEDSDAPSLVEQLSQRRCGRSHKDLPPPLFQLFTELIEAEVDEELARELVEQARQAASPRDQQDPVLLKDCAAKAIKARLRVSGAIRLPESGTRVVALVGPTGVGKTTTVAKLAANFRLHEHRRVGLITVDTYRVAAVEQLRTYADIIDLPMEVVATPREMRQAVDRLAGLELILVDTAGRSPGDEVRIRELKSVLAEAEADEVHLVLSCVASAASLQRAAERFADVGVTALLMTKLDESQGYGNLLQLGCSSRLPFSYLTHGQDVPNDIAQADRHDLTRLILGTKRLA